MARGARAGAEGCCPFSGGEGVCCGGPDPGGMLGDNRAEVATEGTGLGGLAAGSPRPHQCQRAGKVSRQQRDTRLRDTRRPVPGYRQPGFHKPDTSVPGDRGGKLCHRAGKSPSPASVPAGCQHGCWRGFPSASDLPGCAPGPALRGVSPAEAWLSERGWCRSQDFRAWQCAGSPQTPGAWVLLAQGEGEVLLSLQLRSRNTYCKAPKYFPRARAPHPSRRIFGGEGGRRLGSGGAWSGGKATFPDERKTWLGETK